MNLKTLEERQIDNEAESLMMGVTRYRGERLPWSTGKAGKEEAELAPGKALLRDNIEAVATAIEEFLAVAESGKAGRRHVAYPYLLHIDPLQAAYLGLRRCINSASTGATLTATARHIGDTIKEHIEMVKMGADHPGLYRKLTEQLARSASAKHRLGVLRHVREKYQLERLDWSIKERLLLGTKVAELVIEATGLFTLDRHTRRKNDTPLTLAFTPQTVEWLESTHGRCELLSPIHLPMIAPPRAWRTPYSGGYLTDTMRPRLIHTHNRHYLDELGGVDLSEAMAAVNAIQLTPWRVSKPILEAVQTELEMGGGSAGLPRTNSLSMPPLPPGIVPGVSIKQMSASQREDMTAWKGQAAKIHVANAVAKQDRAVLAQKLYVAERFAGEAAIYFPHHLDFRGRVYPLASYLNPQSDDVGRALLEFAEGKPLGEDGAFWLASHIAGLWGVDKVSFDDRVAWVHDNEDAILACALDPHADDAFWREADKPFQALAACYDWMGYKLNGDAHVSHLPIAMDGSCSGLQHYSALLLDEVGGAAVNLVPADRPADIYTKVAKRAQELSDGSLGGTNDDYARAWSGKVSRKVAKQPTMTLCYSATKYGMKLQIEGAVRKLDEDGPYLNSDIDRHKAAIYMSEIVWSALGDVVIAARRAMSWLKAVSDVAVEAKMPIRWTSPIGLPVMQDYRERLGRRLEVFIGGKRVVLILSEDGDKISKRRQASGIAPNFVHSLDAAHLLSTVNLGVDNGLRSFAVIHDSFAVHAADTGMLNAVLRESFVAQYSEPVLERFREEIIEQLEATAPHLVAKIPPLPKTGSLDLEAVKDSEFFFA